MKYLIFLIIPLNQKIIIIKKLVVVQIKDQTGRAAMEKSVGLNSKMDSFLVDDSSEHEKAKGVIRNVVAAINHNAYKDALLNKKCLRHSMNLI